MAVAARRLSALAVVVATCVAATADTPVTSLAGRYSSHFRNGLVDGSIYGSDNIVEIVPVDAGHAYVRFHLEFYNGHSCGLAGVAEAQANTLVYREPADNAVGDTRCTLTIRRQGANSRGTMMAAAKDIAACAAVSWTVICRGRASARSVMCRA